MKKNIKIYGTVSGSLRKFPNEIKSTIDIFRKHNIYIMSPNISEIVNENAQFIYFDHNKTKPIRLIEQTHLRCIEQSDFLYVVNPNGYIGNSTLLEIGYAIAIKKRVFASEEPKDLLLMNLIEYGKGISEIIKTIKESNSEEDIEDQQKLSEIQKYVNQKVIERGFNDETETDILLLLLEEVGELARSVRKYSGLKIQEKRLLEDDSTKIEDELADIFIYLLILANKFGINLYESFKTKELKNEKKTWYKYEPLSQINK